MGGGMKLAESQGKDPWWTAPAHTRSPAAPSVDTAGDRQRDWQMAYARRGDEDIAS
jgi:hypothetical protein